mmetsp:Transcript_5064/g.13617  ORF Transcript_5064/g.13617 Transcript_5064/m.13617 type:complete len:486 (-) Transcript_5064:71-1528(-)
MACAFALGGGLARARRSAREVPAVRMGAAVAAPAVAAAGKKAGPAVPAAVASGARRRAVGVAAPAAPRRRRSAAAESPASQASALVSSRRRVTSGKMTGGLKAARKVRPAAGARTAAVLAPERRQARVKRASRSSATTAAPKDVNARAVDKENGPKVHTVSKVRTNASTTSLNTFMKEVASIELLSEEQCRTLCFQMRQLVVWEELRENLTKTKGAEPSLEQWAAAAGFARDDFVTELYLARSAKQHMVAANLRLVVMIAKRYENLGVNLLDLIQEGSLGLVRGVEKFDHSRGFRFATYATWWIKHFIQVAVMNYSRAIRLPSNISELARRVRQVRTELTMELNRDPSMAQVAKRMCLSEERVRYVVAKASETATVSLDVPLDGGEGVATLGDIITDRSAQPEELVVRSLLKDDLEAVLLLLSPREREIVRLRYGFDDGLSRNYDEIGSLYCVPGNRIRQIETRALRKLRHPSYNSSLRDYAFSS